MDLYPECSVNNADIRERFKRNYATFGTSMKINEFMIGYLYSRHIINDNQKIELLSPTINNRTYKLLNYLMIGNPNIVFDALVYVLIHTGQCDLARLVDRNLYKKYAV